jgi:hypothetical protein
MTIPCACFLPPRHGVAETDDFVTARVERVARDLYFRNLERDVMDAGSTHFEKAREETFGPAVGFDEFDEAAAGSADLRPAKLDSRAGHVWFSPETIHQRERGGIDVSHAEGDVVEDGGAYRRRLGRKFYL